MDDNIIKFQRATEWHCVYDPEYIEDGCPYRMRMITADPERGMFFSRDNIYDLMTALVAMLKEGEADNSRGERNE